MKKIVFALLLAGCAQTRPLEVSQYERPWAPLGCWSRAPLAPSSERETRSFLSTTEPDVIRALLPLEAWESDTALWGDEGTLRVVQSPAAQERIARIVATLEKSRRAPVVLTASLFDVPRETADTLGPIALAAGSEPHNAFLMVPILESVLERLEKHRTVYLQWETTASAPAGRWITCRRETPFPFDFGGIARTASLGVTLALERTRRGLACRVAAIPSPEDGGTLVAFRVFERMPLEPQALTCRAFGDTTSMPVTIPGTLERRAEDAVLLGPNQALALLGRSELPGMVELLVLAPRVGR